MAVFSLALERISKVASTMQEDKNACKSKGLELRWIDSAQRSQVMVFVWCCIPLTEWESWLTRSADPYYFLPVFVIVAFDESSSRRR
jgi:hypothetical protein